MDWTPETNRIQTMHLTGDERAALEAAIKLNGGELFALDGQLVNCPNPSWVDVGIYRAKPAPSPKLSITVNGVTNVVAAGVTEALAIGTKYYVVMLDTSTWFCAAKWRGDDCDHQYLSRGLIHLTEAAARAHAMAMVGLKAEGVL